MLSVTARPADGGCVVRRDGGVGRRRRARLVTARHRLTPRRGVPGEHRPDGAPGDRRVGTVRPCSAFPTAPARASSTSTACSPTPPASTPRRGSRCSTTTCAPAPSGTARRSSRSTSRPTTARTSTASRGWTAPAASCASRGIELPEGGAGRPAGRRDALRAVDPQERPRPGEDPHGRRGRLPGLGALPARREGRRAWPPACVSSSANAEQVLEVAGLSALHRPPGRRGRRQAARPARQARARHVPRRGRRPRRAPRSRPSCSRTRWPASSRARAGGFGFVVGVDRARAGRRAAGARRRRRRRRPRRAAGGADDEPGSGRPFTVEPWQVREPRLDMAAIGQAESVFALSNGHIGLRGNLDEGEPHATPGTYLNSFYEKRPLPVRRGRLRLPRVRPDDHQRHQRQADPAAGRGRAVRPALRRSCATTSGCSTCRPARSPARSSGRRPAGRAVRVRSVRHGVAHPAGDRRDPLRGRGARRARRCSWCSPSWWPTSSCPPATTADPRVEAALTDPLRVGAAPARDDTGATLIHQHPPVRAAGGRRDGPRGARARRASRSPPRPPRTSAAPR